MSETVELKAIDTNAVHEEDAEGFCPICARPWPCWPVLWAFAGRAVAALALCRDQALDSEHAKDCLAYRTEDARCSCERGTAVYFGDTVLAEAKALGIEVPG